MTIFVMKLDFPVKKNISGKAIRKIRQIDKYVNFLDHFEN